jgi:hypothetical protein
VFPAYSASGHLAETKEDRDELSKWGNDLRQTFRTIATVAGVSEIDAKLLMNRSIPGVNAGYITRHKLIEDHLRRQQQAISSAVFATLGSSLMGGQALRGWLSPGAARPATLGCQIRPADHKTAGAPNSTGCLSRRCKRLTGVNETKVGGSGQGSATYVPKPMISHAILRIGQFMSPGASTACAQNAHKEG